jgi:hypothetical protein
MINKCKGTIQRHYCVCVCVYVCVCVCVCVRERERERYQLIASLPTIRMHLWANGEVNEPTESEELRVFIQALIHSLFIHSVVRLTTAPQPLPEPVLHSGRTSVSSFNLQYPHFSLRSFNGCLRLFPRPPVTSIIHATFPSIRCFRRQFIRDTRM